MFGGWYIPFKRRECVGWIEGKGAAPTAKPPRRIPMGVCLYPLIPFVLYLVGTFLRHSGLVIDPMLWAVVWGITTAFSIGMTTHKAPYRFRIWKPGARGSSALFGVSTGTLIFLFMSLTAN